MVVPAFLLYGSPFVFLIWLALPLAIRSYAKLASGTAWPASVPIIARLHVVVGVLLAVSVLLMSL